MQDQIRRLTGPERVRLRPAVIFGDAGLEGATHALEMLLSLMAAECYRGYASQIILTGHRDGTLEIQDNGRGLYLGSGKPEEEHIWKNKLCELFCGSAYPDQIDHKSEYSYFEEAERVPCQPYESEPYEEYALCVVQYASEFMDVTVCRKGLELALHFEKGENVGGISARASDAPSGTLIRWKPDREVFSDIHIPEAWIAEQLQTLAILNPNCQVIYRKETDEGMQSETFCFPEGMAGMLAERCTHSPSTEVYTAEIKATGKDRYNRREYGAKIQVALCFSQDNGYTRFFHNRKALLGGKHIQQLLEELQKQLQWQLDCRIDLPVLSRHLCLSVHTTTTKYASAWSNGRRTQIENAMICDMAQDCVKDSFAHYIKLHRNAIESIFGIGSGTGT